MLLFALVYYPLAGWPAAWGLLEMPGFPRQEAENGVGGGLAAETFASVEDVALAESEDPAIEESAGVLEPAEYSRPQMVLYTSYKVQPGDTISGIAINTGLNDGTLLSVNRVKNSRLLQVGQVLKVPNQDGILYQTAKGDSLEAIARKYESSPEAIVVGNELFSENIPAGAQLFIPGAKMDPTLQQEINGDLFIWPVRGYISSPYGYRSSPFTGLRQFHSGLDIAVPTGTPIRAAMSGYVVTVAYNDTYGNYVVIRHHSGYRTLYGHMTHSAVKTGSFVGTGTVIGYAGSTGLSTGPHLHFTVYKNGVTVSPRTLMK